MNKKFEDIIAEQGRLIYTNEGDSMYPIIRGRDLLIIEAVKEPLRVGDVPLYKRDSGQYVLRRLSQKVFTGGALDEYEQNDLDYLIASGSAGTFENLEYNQMATNLGGDDSRASKRRFIKRRFFISGKALEKHYPFFAKHKALYPLLLIYRPIKGAVTHPKGILTEYKKIKKFKKKEEP